MEMVYLLMAASLLTSCSKESGEAGKGQQESRWPEQSALAAVGGAHSFTVKGDETYVNVMGTTQARTPNYPVLSVKKGYLRGYVADLNGRPLEGAYIGVRSTVGLTTGVSAVTNVNGYYEMQLPFGAITYYASGYTMQYGQGTVVVGLHPADDSTVGFASETGAVKNFVLQSYGRGNKAEVANHPSDPSNYYGGAINLYYNIDYDNQNIPKYIPFGAQIEITLMPAEPGLFGETRSFKIIKKVGTALSTIVNIPVGKYNVSAKLNDGRPLTLTEAGTYGGYYPDFGLKPSGTAGPATVMFVPVYQRTPNMVAPHKSNWLQLTIKLQTT